MNSCKSGGGVGIVESRAGINQRVVYILWNC